MAALRFAKTEPGRYYAKGETHTYLAVRRYEVLSLNWDSERGHGMRIGDRP